MRNWDAKRMIAVALATAGLAGCSPRSAERMPISLEERYAALGTSLPASDPKSGRSRLIPMLPGLANRGGRIVESQDGETHAVRSVFAAPSRGMRQNVIEAVTAATEAKLLRVESKPTETIVAQALLSRFPGTRMQVVTAQRSNAYGPYGLALGVLPSGERCAYAWQWIVAESSAAGGVATTVRSRLCSRDQSLDQLANLLDGIELRRDDAGVRSRPRDRAASRQRTASAPSRAMAPAAEIMDHGRRYIVPVEVSAVPVAALTRSPGSAVETTAAALGVSLPVEALRGPIRPIVRSPSPADGSAPRVAASR